MESERDEELRVLFAAAEKGRADIINTVVEALVAKPKAATAPGASYEYSRLLKGHSRRVFGALAYCSSTTAVPQQQQFVRNRLLKYVARIRS